MFRCTTGGRTLACWGFLRTGRESRKRLLPSSTRSLPTSPFHSSPSRLINVQDAENFTGFDIQILGCAAKMPTVRSGCPCVGLRVGGKQMLFDCGEGTQRQFIHSFLNPSKIQGIFITHMHGDHVFGLPGMLLTFLSLLETTSKVSGPPGFPSAETGDPIKSRTLRVYGPVGLYNYICMTLMLCEAKVGVNAQDGRPVIVVHELVGGEPGWSPRDRRAAFRKRDADFAMPGVESRSLSPEADGFWTIPPFEEDADGEGAHGGGAGFLLPPPQRRRQDFVVRAGMVKHTVPTFAYTVQEHDKPGTMDVAAVRARGLRPGPAYKALTEGRDVALPGDAGVVRAAEVMGPRKRGRKLTVLGDTSDPYAVTALARDSDVLLHEATLEDRMQAMAVSRGHSTPSMAARFARHVRARRLVLTHLSNRYTCRGEGESEEASLGREVGGGRGGRARGGACYGPGRDQQFLSPPPKPVAMLMQQAAAVLGEERRVLVAEDFLKIHVPLEGFDMLGEDAAAQTPHGLEWRQPSHQREHEKQATGVRKISEGRHDFEDCNYEARVKEEETAGRTLSS